MSRTHRKSTNLLLLHLTGRWPNFCQTLFFEVMSKATMSWPTRNCGRWSHHTTLSRLEPRGFGERICGRLFDRDQLADVKTQVAVTLLSSAVRFLKKRLSKKIILGLLPTPKLNACSPHSRTLWRLLYGAYSDLRVASVLTRK